MSLIDAFALIIWVRLNEPKKSTQKIGLIMSSNSECMNERKNDNGNHPNCNKVIRAIAISAKVANIDESLMSFFKCMFKQTI
ncbi:hypothetical protein BLOT_013288 [Blomia tropicalis]|nr:hypothetical protein BLOT_013288 [Blomia tropicalis]